MELMTCPICKEEFQKDDFALLELSCCFASPINENKMVMEFCNNCMTKLWPEVLKILSDYVGIQEIGT